MSTIATQDRADCSADYQRQEADGFAGLLKADIQAAVDAADGWVSANSASYNTALPLTARTALTAKQKAKLLMLVIAKRYGLGVYN